MSDELGSNPKFAALSPEAQEIVRNKLSSLSPAAQRIVKQKLGSTQGDAVSANINRFLKSPAYSTSIPGIANNLYGAMEDVANKGGQIAAEKLAEKGLEPHAAAAIGTALQMTPQAATMLATPTESATTEIPEAATAMGRRALGYKMAELKTPFARGQATNAAKIALQEGIIPRTGNVETALSRATNLANKTGQEIGAIRESVGPQEVAPIKDALNSLRQKLTLGADEGIMAQANKKIDSVIASIDSIAGKPQRNLASGIIQKQSKMSISQTEAIKKRIADSVSWLEAKSNDADAKSMVYEIENAVKKQLSDAGIDMKNYAKLKTKYGAAKSMTAALNKQVARDQGNMPISLPSIIYGVSSGNPVGALGEMAGMELVKRRGAGVAANLINDAAQARGYMQLPMNTYSGLLDYLRRKGRQNQRSY